MTSESSFHISSLIREDQVNVPAIDGRSPDYVLSPCSEEEFTEAVAWARRTKCALVPIGGATEVAQGNPLRCGAWSAVCTTSWAGIVDYSPEDLVITVRAGTTLQDLQNALQPHNQMLPFDPPFPGRATIGGITATNAQGLWRSLFGLPRDRLLGLRFVTGDGRIVKAGGKVVKNVAGYDVGKVMAGSWGTLGIITEVTYKTQPLPQARLALVAGGGDIASLLEAAQALYRERLEPAYAVVRLVPEARLMIGLMGNRNRCAWQASAIRDLLAKMGISADVRPDDGAAALEDEVRHAGAECCAALRVITAPSDLVSLYSQSAPVICRRAQAANVYAATGITDLFFGSTDAAVEVAAALHNALPTAGRIVWQKMPPNFAVVDAWGSAGDAGAFRLMGKLKDALDPDGILCPGRFVGRL
ncbi:MAG: FAD-binding oxidoreductase [Chthonomonadales bacterium]